MIYDFGHLHDKFHGTCPSCSMKNIENTDYHIIATCTRIMHIRNNYFRRVYNDLAQIYTKPNKVHDLKFAQEVVKWLRGISTGFVDQWWQVASGANVLRAGKLTHGYNIDKITGQQRTFLYKLKAHVMIFINMVTNIVKRPNTIPKYYSLYKEVFIREWFPQIIKTKIEWEFFKRQNNLGEDDIIIYTDGSFKEFKDGNKYAAGFGIYIRHRGVKYMFSQAIGDQSILYAEQMAIAKIPFLLKLLGISTLNKRVLICTDNETTYRTAYTHNTIGSYPSLLSKIREIIKMENYLLIKVKSHIKVDPIIGNEIADVLANAARDYSHIAPAPIDTPDLDSNLYSTLIHCYFGCSGKTTSWQVFDVGW